MYFESLQQLLNMNGHGAYVWSAYAITIIVLLGLMRGPTRRYRKALERVARRRDAERSIRATET